MKSLRIVLLISFCILINGCSGNNSIESLFRPDPDISSNQNSSTDNNDRTNQNNNNNSNQNTNNQVQISQNNKDNNPQLPKDFPKDIPIYQSAKLIYVNENKTTWQVDEPTYTIKEYYQQQLTKQEWDLIKVSDNFIQAEKKANDRRLKIQLSVVSNQTQFIINQEKIEDNNKTNQKQNNNQTNNNNSNSANADLSPNIEKLVQLDIIDDKNNLNIYQTVTRREYARWLFKTNNIVYGDVNSKIIRSANPNSEPLYADVSPNDPDFKTIQGLAEAGLIPSKLTQSSLNSFNPDKPLTREDLIAWKVPLDFRQKLPTTTIDNLKESWAFQDVSKISPTTWSKLYLDWQNGENANIRKAFGYITLFQPQKPVTYQEAAEVLSSFGYQQETIYLQDIN